MNNVGDNRLLKILAKRVKQLREDRGLTQEDAYNDTGVHFGRIEQGQRNISFTSLNKLCEYFEISLKEFFSKDFD